MDEIKTPSSEISEDQMSETSLDDPESPQKHTLEDLQQKRVQDLKIICDSMNISKAGKKADIIDRILRTQELDEEALRATLDQLRKSGKRGGDVHHQYYKKSFNLIDVHDKYWYDIQPSHTISHWQAKLSISLLDIGLVNTFALGKQKKMTFASFTSQLTRKSLDESFDI